MPVSLELLDLVAKLQDRLDSTESQRDAWAEKAAEAGQYEALNRALGDRLGVYMTRLAEAREVLKAVEWQGDEFGERCASCGGRDLPNDEQSRQWAKTLQSRCGHAPDCKLTKCLESVND